MSEKQSNVANANKRILRRSIVVALVMFVFGFAVAPFYDSICRALGISNKTGRIEESSTTAVTAVNSVNKNRVITVEFTGNAMAGLPWEFEPVVKKIQVHPGEITTVNYRVRNPTAETIVGQAVPSVTPALSAAHFNKIECFCFSRQKLKPGQTREMPVRFVVDAALPPEVHTVTLSYGFFNTNKAQAKRFGGDAVSSAAKHTHHAGSGS